MHLLRLHKRVPSARSINKGAMDARREEEILAVKVPRLRRIFREIKIADAACHFDGTVNVECHHCATAFNLLIERIERIEKN